jgi:hypothetical protein
MARVPTATAAKEDSPLGKRATPPPPEYEDVVDLTHGGGEDDEVCSDAGARDGLAYPSQPRRPKKARCARADAPVPAAPKSPKSEASSEEAPSAEAAGKFRVPPRKPALLGPRPAPGNGALRQSKFDEQEEEEEESGKFKVRPRKPAVLGPRPAPGNGALRQSKLDEEEEEEEEGAPAAAAAAAPATPPPQTQGGIPFASPPDGLVPRKLPEYDGTGWARVELAASAPFPKFMASPPAHMTRVTFGGHLLGFCDNEEGAARLRVIFASFVVAVAKRICLDNPAMGSARFRALLGCSNREMRALTACRIVGVPRDVDHRAAIEVAGQRCLKVFEEGGGLGAGLTQQLPTTALGDFFRGATISGFFYVQLRTEVKRRDSEEAEDEEAEEGEADSLGSAEF